MEKFFENVEMNCFFKSFLHVITRKASRAECGAACRVDRLSAGLIGRLGVTFNARRSEQIGHGLKQSDVVILNTGETLTPALSLDKGRGSKVKEILNQVQNDDINNRNGPFTSHHSLFTRKLAFTLAEVLITLGIIGIVAAMTIPNLITNYQKKQTALEVKKAYTELNQILKMAIADYGEPSGWDYYKANELPLWVQTYFEPYVKVSGAKTCTSMEECLGLPLPYSLKFAKPGSVNTQVGQYAVSKLGSPIGYGFFRYGGVYENVTRVKVYIRKTTGKKLAWRKQAYGYVGKDVFTFILTTADSNPTFKPYGLKPLGSYGISTNDRKTLLGTGWGGCNPKASGSGYWTPGDACAAVIMLDGWKISKDYPW